MDRPADDGLLRSEDRAEPPAGLDYFDATRPDVHAPVAGKRSVWAIACASGAVGAGIFLGLSEPQGPARGLAATALGLMGLLTGLVGAWAWRQPQRSHIDASLSAISIALGALCVAAAVRIGIP